MTTRVSEAAMTTTPDVPQDETSIILRPQKSGYVVHCPTCGDAIAIARWKDYIHYVMRQVHRHQMSVHGQEENGDDDR